MNRNQIEIATTLPEPHFEDESTIVAAQQVVPLDLAQTEDRRRKLLRLLPLLLAATLCGALGAVAVNRLDKRNRTPPQVSQPEASTKVESAQPTPAQVSIASSKTEPAADDESPTTSPKRETSADGSGAKDPNIRAVNTKTGETVSRKVVRSEPRELVRPRRVNPPSERPRGKQSKQGKAGAGRIADIFGGSNP